MMRALLETCKTGGLRPEELHLDVGQDLVELQVELVVVIVGQEPVQALLARQLVPGRVQL